MLTQSERMKDDPRWAELCERVARADTTVGDWERLQRRAPNRLDDPTDWDTAPYITYKRKDVRQENTRRLVLLAEGSVPIAQFSAENGSPEARSAKADDAYNLQNAVTLAVGARVMVNNNLSVQHGVTNGAFGVVVDIVYAPGSKPPDLPLCVLAQLDGWHGEEGVLDGMERVVPIAPFTAEWSTAGGRRLQRVQIPLCLAWSFTVHKSQGQSFDRAHINLGAEEGTLGHTLVALSRLRSEAGLMLDAITLERLRKSGEAGHEELRHELDRLCELVVTTARHVSRLPICSAKPRRRLSGREVGGNSSQRLRKAQVQASFTGY
eukprot:m.370369 g.370369  ORF g.370369 m.370369 type:complete len:322 (+) comp16680_c1_seq59:1203-2168(+)